MIKEEIMKRSSWQQRKRDENERKILKILAQHKKLTWTQIMDKSNISRPQLAIHLQRMEGEGKIGHIDRFYFAASEELSALHQFNMLEMKGKQFSRYVDQPLDWLDKYGLAPFNEEEERERTRIFVKNQYSLYLFLLMRLARYIYEKKRRSCE